MNTYEAKYGKKEDARTRELHINCRIFAIVDGKLIIAEKDYPHSHATWLTELGVITPENDELMDTIVRGRVEANGDVRFYSGYDFVVNEDIERTFFAHLAELVKRLDMDTEAYVYGGLQMQVDGCPPRKEYGTIKENLGRTT